MAVIHISPRNSALTEDQFTNSRGCIGSLLVQGSRGERVIRVIGVVLRWVGGACARLVVSVVRAWPPSLTSVRGSRVGSGAGDMMVDGDDPAWGSVAAARSFWAGHAGVAAGT